VIYIIKINNCIINYTFADKHIEIEYGNKKRYNINLNDMYKKDKKKLYNK